VALFAVAVTELSWFGVMAWLALREGSADIMASSPDPSSA